VFENVGVLSQDDAWLQGQAQALRDAAVPPLTLRCGGWTTCSSA